MGILRSAAATELYEQRRALFIIPAVIAGFLLFLGINQLQAGPGSSGSASAADSMAGLTVTTAATLLSLAAVFFPVTAVLRDRSRRTAAFIWSRPISVPLYLLGRFLGALTPVIAGIGAAIVIGLGLVFAAYPGNLSTLLTSMGQYLALFIAQVPVAVLYPSALTFCLASISGSEELAFLVGGAYWFAARVFLGNAWMVNFATVTLSGATPAALAFNTLGAPLLLNRLFYGILTGGLLLASVVFYNRLDERPGWWTTLSHPLGGRVSWLVFLVCVLALGLIVTRIPGIHMNLPPAWQFF